MIRDKSRRMISAYLMYLDWRSIYGYFYFSVCAIGNSVEVPVNWHPIKVHYGIVANGKSILASRSIQLWCLLMLIKSMWVYRCRWNTILAYECTYIKCCGINIDKYWFISAVMVAHLDVFSKTNTASTLARDSPPRSSFRAFGPQGKTILDGLDYGGIWIKIKVM